MFRSARYDLAGLEDTLRNGSMRERNFYGELLRRSGVAGTIGAFTSSFALGTGLELLATRATHSDLLGIGAYVLTFFYSYKMLLPTIKDYYKNHYLTRLAKKIEGMLE